MSYNITIFFLNGYESFPVCLWLFSHLYFFTIAHSSASGQNERELYYNKCTECN